MNYKNTIENIDLQIEELLLDILENRTYKSPKAEERLTALCLVRQYIKDKIREKRIKECKAINVSVIEQGVNNEG